MLTIEYRNSEQLPNYGNGLCDNALQAVYDLAAAKDQKAVDEYICLLNLLCVAHTSPDQAGTCQFLLAGAGCIMNRILGLAEQGCANSNGY